MFIDTHCHLNLEEFTADYKAVIARAKENDVKAVINVGANLVSSRRAIEIARETSDNIFATVGMHPTDAAKENFDKEEFLRLVQNEKVVAIGEIGLDYFSQKISRQAKLGHFGDNIDKAAQMELLKKQLQVANEIAKPVILHCREAYDDLILVLKSLPKIPRGVVHCYVGDIAHAEIFLGMGLYISFTGIITFAKSVDLIKVVEKVPLDKILIETDAPWLAPEPFRGKRNEPAYVKEVARKIAEIKKVTLAEIADQTTANAEKLFGLKINEK